jgi:hypothetical protein
MEFVVLSFIFIQQTNICDDPVLSSHIITVPYWAVEYVN